MWASTFLFRRESSSRIVYIASSFNLTSITLSLVVISRTTCTFFTHCLFVALLDTVPVDRILSRQGSIHSRATRRKLSRESGTQSTGGRLRLAPEIVRFPDTKLERSRCRVSEICVTRRRDGNANAVSRGC